MANIQPEITAFKSAVYGEDVRDAMVSLANKLNTEVSTATTTVAGYDTRLTDLNNFINELSGAWYKKISLTRGVVHSSNDDVLTVDIPAGNNYFIYVSFGDAYTCTVYANGSSLGAHQCDGSISKYTASTNVNRIGVYIDPQTTGDLELFVYLENSEYDDKLKTLSENSIFSILSDDYTTADKVFRFTNHSLRGYGNVWSGRSNRVSSNGAVYVPFQMKVAPSNGFRFGYMLPGDTWSGWFTDETTIPSGYISLQIARVTEVSGEIADIEEFASALTIKGGVLTSTEIALPSLETARIIVPISFYSYEAGGIYNGNNDDSGIGTRCRTAGYIPIKQGDVFALKNNRVKIVVYVYANDKKVILESSTSWTDGYIVEDANATFARIAVRKADNSSIADDEIPELMSIVKFTRSDIWNEIEKCYPGYLSHSNIIKPVSEFECESGGIYNNNPTEDSTRCRTSGFIPVSSGLFVSTGENFFVLFFYDYAKRYIGNSGNWNSGYTEINTPGTCYIRVAMRNPQSSVIGDDEIYTVAESFSIVRAVNESSLMAEGELPTYFASEVIDCRDKLEAYCTEKALVFAVVTDSHIYDAYNYNSMSWWNATVANMREVANVYPIDAIVHMGDMVNGSEPKATTEKYIRKTRDELRSVVTPTFLLVGNHDDNSYHSEIMSLGDMYALCGRNNEIDVTSRPSNNMYWYKDYDNFGIRVVFLCAITGGAGGGQQGANWGYSNAQVSWFTNEALNTDNQVLIFSHMSFSQGYMGYDASLPVNGNLMKQAAESFINNGGEIVGLINGHTHFDYANNNGSFYEISQGCETNTGNTADKTGTSIYSYAPSDAIQYGRARGTLTQDLWNILVVRPVSKTCKLIRFGAGEDVEWSY